MCQEYYAKTLGLSEHQIILFPEAVAENFNGYCINLAQGGSCNDRILRRIMIECLNQRALNPTQPIIALIEITLMLRKEIWRDNVPAGDPEESNFHSVQLARLKNWWDLSRKQSKIDNGDAIILRDLNSTEQKYLKMWQQGEMFFLQPIC